VDDLAGATDLPTLLRDHSPAGGQRRGLAERVGTALAELHASGFATPDLAAKHLFVGDGDDPVSVIDWPSAPKPGRVRDVDVIRWLGGLHAGVPDELANDRERLLVLWAYRRACRRLGRPVPNRFGFMAKSVNAAAKRRQNRSSVRTQRTTTDLRQRLVWVAGEAVVAIPEVAAEWPTPAECPPFYPASPVVTPPHGKRERVTLPCGRSAVLVRFHTVDPVGRMVSVVRERPWRSPAATAARVLFHLQRHGLPAPRLLAFGQRYTSAVAAESFVCADMPPSAVTLSTFLSRPTTTPAASAAVLAECGRLLRQLHDAGLRPESVASTNDALFVVSDDETASVAVGSPFAVRLVKRAIDAQRAADLKRLIAPLDSTAGGWVSGGYHGAGG
jgi:tRNA A-37 threonylcarbamoyl transferase component Bud32